MMKFIERNEERIKATSFVLNTLAILIWGSIGVNYFFF